MTPQLRAITIKNRLMKAGLSERAGPCKSGWWCWTQSGNTGVRLGWDHPWLPDLVRARSRIIRERQLRMKALLESQGFVVRVVPFCGHGYLVVNRQPDGPGERLAVVGAPKAGERTPTHMWADAMFDADVEAVAWCALADEERASRAKAESALQQAEAALSGAVDYVGLPALKTECREALAAVRAATAERTVEA